MAPVSLASARRLSQKRRRADGGPVGNPNPVAPMTDFARLRLGMVDGQIRVADVTDHRVLAAFLSVPREAYVPADRRAIAYLDARVPLGPPGRAMLDPMILARLVQLADPQPGDRVLVVGCGLGYTAAIFAELAAHVVGLEQDPALASAAKASFSADGRVTVVEGKLTEGAPAEGPFDLVFCDGAVADGLENLLAQLASSGRMIAPTGAGPATKATVFRASAGEAVGAATFDAVAPRLPGFQPVETFAL
jgi:protein-L-isoaspartate(D-aspartate) O-methyltransferase